MEAGSVDGKPYPDGYQAVYEDEIYIPIGGYGWSFAMVIDVVRLRALQFASSEQLGTLAETLWVPGSIPVPLLLSHPVLS